MSSDHAATIQYRLNLPHALHSVSPALSALHASRATALHPEISAVLRPSHCPKCGTYHFSGDHSSYLVGLSAKKKRRRAIYPHAKVLQRRCHLCGFSIDGQLPGQASRTRSVPSVPKAKETGQEPPLTDVPQPAAAGTVQATKYTPTPPLPRQSGLTGHAKTITIKDMHFRDRQREDATKSYKKKEGHEGLAAFLKEV